MDFETLFLLTDKPSLVHKSRIYYYKIKKSSRLFALFWHASQKIMEFIVDFQGFKNENNLFIIKDYTDEKVNELNLFHYLTAPIAYQKE